MCYKIYFRHWGQKSPTPSPDKRQWIGTKNATNFSNAIFGFGEIKNEGGRDPREN
jgi:hypothetical protein